MSDTVTLTVDELNALVTKAASAAVAQALAGNEPAKVEAPAKKAVAKCGAPTIAGNPCKRPATGADGRCGSHTGFTARELEAKAAAGRERQASFREFLVERATKPRIDNPALAEFGRQNGLYGVKGAKMTWEQLKAAHGDKFRA